MKVIESIAELRAYRRDRTGSVGFVPTMGALHAGHLSLVERSRLENDATVASIYVNPTQFNNPNDLANYPDTLQEDLDQLCDAGVEAVFLPTYDMLYPDDFAYEIDEKMFSRELCGANRPGHFTGVLTVVMKLLNLVRPTRAYFGEKDFQQLTLVRGMVDAFFIDTEIVGCPIVREPDGLAMSSRNLNLTTCDRRRSPSFNRILRDDTQNDIEVRDSLSRSGFKVDYVETRERRRYGAVVIGNEEKPVRLIDNVEIG